MTIYTEDKVSSDALKRSERFFWVVVFAALLVYLGRNAFWGNEADYAEMGREMALRGDFWHPTVNWKPTYAPPLFDWLRIPFFRLWGFSEWSCRLSGIVCGWLLVLSTVQLGRRFFDRRTALLGGWLIFGSYGLLFWSRTALPYMAAAMFATWSIVAYLAYLDEPGFFHALLFYLLLGAGVLTGRIYPALAVVGFVLPYTVSVGGFGKWFKLAFFGALLTAVIVVAGLTLAPKFWGEPELVKAYSWGNFWHRMVIGVITPADGREPFYLVPYHALRLTLPWGILVIAALIGAVRNFRKNSPEIRGLALGVAGMLAVMMLIRSRTWELTLPLLPVLLCLVAGALTQADLGDAKVNLVAGKVMFYLAMLCGALALAFIVVIPVWRVFVSELELPLVIKLTVPLAGLVAQTILLFNDEAARSVDLPERFGSSVLAAGVLMVAIFGFIYPSLNDFRRGRSFWEENGARLRQAAEARQLVVYGDDAEAEMLFYAHLPRPAQVLKAPTSEARQSRLQEFLRHCRGPVTAIVSDSGFRAELEEYGFPTSKVELKMETLAEVSHSERDLNLIYYLDFQSQGDE